MTKPIATGWAIMAGGAVVVTALWPGATENDVWATFNGWPDPDEITEAKRRGARAFRVRVVEMEEGE